MPSPYFDNYGIVTVTTATVAITDEGYVGQRIVMNRAAGITATLPEATGSGNRYEFIGAVDASGDQIIQVTGDDTMAGVAYLGNDSAGASCFYTADTSDTITLDGSTKGGLKGWRVVCDDIAADTWAVIVMSEASGTEESVFSAAVS
jgi:autotransporter adhesin